MSALPREATFIRAIHPEWEWGPNEHLLATLIDLTGQANSKKGTWKALKRPTDKKPVVVGAGAGLTPAQLRERLAARGTKGGGSDG